MPRVQFTFPARRIQIVKVMPTPRVMSSLDAWFKQARKVIPQIPDLDGQWYLGEEVVELRWIKFTLQSGIGETAYVLIDREYSSMTA